MNDLSFDKTVIENLGQENVFDLLSAAGKQLFLFSEKVLFGLLANRLSRNGIPFRPQPS